MREPAPAIDVSRRRFLATVGAGAAGILPACQALDRLDTSAAAEGTGIQIIGAIQVLAKYRATPRQATLAEQKARRAFVDRGMRPALAAEKKKVAARRQKRVAQARRSRPAAGSPDPVAEIEKESASELAALDSAWREAATRYTRGEYSGGFKAGSSPTAVALATLRPADVLTASASYLPRNLAVPVPPAREIAGAAASVMFYDTRQHTLARQEVYALNREPEPDRLTRFDDVEAQFVGP